MRNMLVLLAVLPTFALAEDRATVDVLESCLTAPAAGSDARDCIGVIATQCMAAPEGQTTVGMMQCALAEAEAWDVLLNRYYRQARALTRDMDAGFSRICGARRNPAGRAARLDQLSRRQLHRPICAMGGGHDAPDHRGRLPAGNDRAAHDITVSIRHDAAMKLGGRL